MAELNKKSRGWTWTAFNYTEDDIERLKAQAESKDVTYVCFGREIAPTTKNMHLQGYTRFSSPRTGKYAIKWIGTGQPHVEPTKGSPKQNKSYCSKEGDFWEHGELPAQGKRTDLDAIKAAVKEGKNMREIADMCESYQAVRMAEIWQKYMKPPPVRDVTLHWYWGNTGTGKSFSAFKEAYEKSDGDYWTAGIGNREFWEGYCGQKKIVLDELRKNTYKWADLLKITDKYPLRVMVKGSSQWLMADEIWITSCKHPADLFAQTHASGDSVAQMLRRITDLREFTEVWKPEGPEEPDSRLHTSPCTEVGGNTSDVVASPTSTPRKAKHSITELDY